MDIGKTLMFAGLSIAGGALSGVMTYGIYGAFRDSGKGPYASGAAAGAVGGAIGAVSLVALQLIAPGVFDPTANWETSNNMSGLTVQQMRGFRGFAIRELPRAMGMVTARQLGALSGVEVDMLN